MTKLKRRNSTTCVDWTKEKQNLCQKQERKSTKKSLFHLKKNGKSGFPSTSLILPAAQKFQLRTEQRCCRQSHLVPTKGGAFGQAPHFSLNLSGADKAAFP